MPLSIGPEEPMKSSRGLSLLALTALPFAADASEEGDRAEVSRLDVKYQAAVKRNDADTMGGILHEGFILVLGDGRTFSRKDLLDSARSREVVYEMQDEKPGSQTVRVYGDTAIVTALLVLKGISAGKPFDRQLWFSDTYVRTKSGWKYAFGQASLPLPAEKR